MVSKNEAQILQKLAKWEQQAGELPGLAGLYRELLVIQSKAKKELIASRQSPFDSIISQTTINERLAQGSPLLSFSDLSLDWERVKAVFEDVGKVVAKYSPDLSGEIESLKKITSVSPLLQRVVKEWFQGSSLDSIAQANGVDTELLSFVVQTTLKVYLSLYSEALQPKVSQELWLRQYCPICGGKPDFAYLDKERGARWLLCSRCDAEWLFLRLACPYCGSQNQDTLAYFTDDEGLYRLYVCEQCRTYIKAIDLRHTEAEVLLPLERVLTLDMDSQGQEKGYRPGHWGSKQSGYASV